MVIISTAGGLGNQMFQYAAGRALALRRNAALQLDISAHGGDGGARDFDLQRVFSLDVTIARDADVRQILGWQSSRVARRVLARPGLAVLRKRALIAEPHFNYWAGLAVAPEDCYLVGYWQSERYFKDHEQAIRADFRFRHPLTGRNEELADAMRRVGAVSLHVRRGDYASDPRTNSVHGLCSLAYYQVAIRFVAERVESPHFFVFSDDIPWAMENLHLPFPCEFVADNRGPSSFVDMHLMSLCRHHIIANSSFSWWGAWLNPDPHKIVIAPQKWFATNARVDDLIPAAWVRL